MINDLAYARTLLESACRSILVAIGENPDRPGLIETPERFARLWLDFANFDAGDTDKLFAAHVDQMVIATGIETYSVCEHHLLPFKLRVDLGYLAKDQVVGISKLARITHKFAHRVQMQEQFTNDLATELIRVTQQPDAAVLVRGQHLCMMMRGAKTTATITTSAMHGEFRANSQTRTEFLRLADHHWL